jgi:archaellum component FlaF (FlaF/FlaG flagellin family)
VNSICIPCFCNGHSQVCDSISGENCRCEDETETDTDDCRPSEFGTCWHAQCGACKSNSLFDGLSLPLEGNPTNGRFCYGVPNEQGVTSQTLQPGQVVHFMVVPTFTNVDLKLFVEQDMARVGARVRVYVTTNINSSLDDNGLPQFDTEPVLAEEVVSRKRFDISNANYNFVNDHFYVTLQNRGTEATTVQFAFLQPVIAINLFVFFSVFFSAFYLFLAALIGVAMWRRTMEEQIRSQQEQVQLEVRAVLQGRIEGH